MTRIKAFAGICVLVTAGGLLPGISKSGRIDTNLIIQETVQPQVLDACMQWRYPIGLCVWLTCTPVGCSVDTSLMAGHYNPDLVVSAYHRTADNPWEEAKSLYGALQLSAGQTLLQQFGLSVFLGGGVRVEDMFYPDHRNLIFKETDAIGHPVASVNQWIATAFPMLCPSETQSFVPYLLSTSDLLAWRFAIPEGAFPEAWVPGLREIGRWPLNTWGAVYPRHGFVTQSEDPKAAAVVAQRAGDLVTRSQQPHVYLPTTATQSSGGMHVWWPGPLREMDRASGHWQMLVPLISQGCEIFGADDTTQPASWADGKVDPEGDYVWTLWRPYKCCPRAGQALIFYTQWLAWPPP